MALQQVHLKNAIVIFLSLQTILKAFFGLEKMCNNEGFFVIVFVSNFTLSELIAPFTMTVLSTAAAQTSTTGFNLVYNQVSMIKKTFFSSLILTENASVCLFSLV